MRALLTLVRLFGRLPAGASRAYARVLNAAATPFDAVNLRRSRWSLDTRRLPSGTKIASRVALCSAVGTAGLACGGAVADRGHQPFEHTHPGQQDPALHQPVVARSNSTIGRSLASHARV